jgi:predicted RNA binding protein YcfA (HicA-like mRNA interferase family)
MGQLGNISGKAAVKAFERAGWSVRGQVGSHVMMFKPGVHANLSVPQHKELSVGTLRKPIRVAGLAVDEFLDLCQERTEAKTACLTGSICTRQFRVFGEGNG